MVPQRQTVLDVGVPVRYVYHIPHISLTKQAGVLKHSSRTLRAYCWATPIPGGAWPKSSKNACCIISGTCTARLTKMTTKSSRRSLVNYNKILKSAMKLGKKYGSVKDIPKRSVQRLQNRIDALATDTYDNADCNRYAEAPQKGGQIPADISQARGCSVPQQCKRAGNAHVLP